MTAGRHISEEPLFPAVPVKLTPGQPVRVQTMWGDESGIIVDFSHNQGWPMVSVAMARGDTISIDIARVRSVSEPVDCGDGVCVCGGCVL